jgi:hypothetical protein
LYFDDILIYSKTKEEHLDHLIQVCTTLKKKSLFANVKTLFFFTNRVVFLGFIVLCEEVFADPQKVQVIVNWHKLKNIHEVHSLLGLTTFYHRFINGFATIMSFITNYLKQSEF